MVKDSKSYPLSCHPMKRQCVLSVLWLCKIYHFPSYHVSDKKQITWTKQQPYFKTAAQGSRRNAHLYFFFVYTRCHSCCRRFAVLPPQHVFMPLPIFHLVDDTTQWLELRLQSTTFTILKTWNCFQLKQKKKKKKKNGPIVLRKKKAMGDCFF